jgi:hypothetical protein
VIAATPHIAATIGGDAGAQEYPQADGPALQDNAPAIECGAHLLGAIVGSSLGERPLLTYVELLASQPLRRILPRIHVPDSLWMLPGVGAVIE